MTGGSGGKPNRASVDATDVGVDARVAILLSTPIAPGSAVGQAVSVVGPAGAVSGKVVAAEGGQLLFFNPGMEWLPQATYTVFVQGMTDRNGRAFPFSASSFTTRSFDGSSSSSTGSTSVSATTGASGTRAAQAASSSFPSISN